jgi:hypothetical protein
LSTFHDDPSQLRFPFTGKPGINVDLEDPSSPLEYCELICMPDIAEVIARETNLYAQKFKKKKHAYSKTKI